MRSDQLIREMSLRSEANVVLSKRKLVPISVHGGVHWTKLHHWCICVVVLSWTLRLRLW
jgi:hypothetical protein